jgi:2-dehydropantoate 2-reductase
MRICIFGAGAVGSHFAVRLALAGHDVCCVMRGPHLEAVKANGLTLRVGDAEFPARVKASDDPAAWAARPCHQHAEGEFVRQPGHGPAAAARQNRQ